MDKIPLEMTCPGCGAKSFRSFKVHRTRLKSRWKCRQCGKMFPAKAWQIRTTRPNILRSRLAAR